MSALPARLICVLLKRSNSCTQRRVKIVFTSLLGLTFQLVNYNMTNRMANRMTNRMTNRMKSFFAKNLSSKG